MTRIFFLSQLSPILELFPFDEITLKSHNYICIVVTVMDKQCWSQAVLESGSWGNSVLQTPALVETAWAIFTRFHMGPSFRRVLTIYLNDSNSLNKMAAMLVYDKSTEKSSSPELRKLWGWILIYSIGDSKSTKFIQMMYKGWPLMF